MEEVDAVKSDSQREQIEARLAERGALYLDVWKFGLNTALRISDLLAIRMDEIGALDPDHPVLEVVESKTGKTRRITLNRGESTRISGVSDTRSRILRKLSPNQSF